MTSPDWKDVDSRLAQVDHWANSVDHADVLSDRHLLDGIMVLSNAIRLLISERQEDKTKHEAEFAKLAGVEGFTLGQFRFITDQIILERTRNKAVLDKAVADEREIQDQLIAAGDKMGGAAQVGVPNAMAWDNLIRRIRPTTGEVR